MSVKTSTDDKVERNIDLTENFLTNEDRNNVCTCVFLYLLRCNKFAFLNITAMTEIRQILK